MCVGSLLSGPRWRLESIDKDDDNRRFGAAGFAFVVAVAVDDVFQVLPLGKTSVTKVAAEATGTFDLDFDTTLTSLDRESNPKDDRTTTIADVMFMVITKFWI